MKKLLSILLTALLAVTLLAGCGNPVGDDLENFLNIEVVDVNENYKKIAAEAELWATYETDEQVITSLEDVLLPLVNESLEKLEKVEPETEEVTELKEKYIKFLEEYKDGFNDILDGFKASDDAKIEEGNAKVSDGLELLNDYNSSLEALAEENGLKIEY